MQQSVKALRNAAVSLREVIARGCFTYVDRKGEIVRGHRVVFPPMSLTILLSNSIVPQEIKRVYGIAAKSDRV